MGYSFLAYAYLCYGQIFAPLSPLQFSYMLFFGFTLTVLVGFLLFAKGLLARRRLPRLANEREGGIVTITPKALRNITYVTVEQFPGIIEDRVKVRISKGRKPTYYVKIWLGLAEYSELPACHEALRQSVGAALERATGLPCRRVDLVFYTARKESAHVEGGQAK